MSYLITITRILEINSECPSSEQQLFLKNAALEKKITPPLFPQKKAVTVNTATTFSVI